MAIFKKKATKKKNVTKTFVDGKEQDPEVPDTVPELDVPTPPPEEKVEQPLSAQEVYEEGRSVGFQEGMIYAMEVLNITLKNHQDKLRKKLAEKQQVIQP